MSEVVYARKYQNLGTDEIGVMTFFRSILYEESTAITFQIDSPECQAHKVEFKSVIYGRWVEILA